MDKDQLICDVLATEVRALDNINSVSNDIMVQYDLMPDWENVLRSELLCLVQEATRMAIRYISRGISITWCTGIEFITMIANCGDKFTLKRHHMIFYKKSKFLHGLLLVGSNMCPLELSMMNSDQFLEFVLPHIELLTLR